jgi:hypothetical protein
VTISGTPYQPSARVIDGAVFIEVQMAARANPVIKPIEAAEVLPPTIPPRTAPPSAVPSATAAPSTVPLPATSERNEHRLSMFSEAPHASASVSYFPKRNRRLRQAAWAVLVVVVILASATAAAGYFYPNETRDVMRRANGTIAHLFARAIGHSTVNREPASAPSGSSENKE